VRGYKPAMLNALLYEDRKLLDGFDKQMSIYPVEDWPHFGYFRESMVKEYMEDERVAAAAGLVERIRNDIEARGPLSSLEVEEDTRLDWWLAGSVRAARIALDILLYGGQTIVHHRVGTRRYSELSERLLPPRLITAPKPHTSQEDYLDWHVFRRAGGLGLVDLKVTTEFGGMVGWRGGQIRAAITRLAEKGWLLPVAIEELPRQRFYVRRDDLPELEASNSSRRKQAAALIAPLDNLMWDINLVENLFDFHYAWEVYKPADKRNYGYCVLPVLYGDRFVARMDPGFDRASGVFTIKNWWWEEDVDRKDEAMLAAVGDCLAAFGKYLEANEIRLGAVAQRDPGLARAVRRRKQSVAV
jgi:uncharacterized protein YcaQ